MIPEFRVWDKADKVYDVPTQIDIDDSGHISCVDTYHGSLVDSDLVLEQYTGLKDVEGNKIFEGDIVRIDDYETVAVRYGTQDHEEEYGDHFMYKGWNVNLGGGYPDATMNDLKILGNIHENPELLEVEK